MDNLGISEIQNYKRKLVTLRYKNDLYLIEYLRIWENNIPI